MDEKKCECGCNCDNKKWWKHAKLWHGGGGGHIYGLGVLGALFYFLQNVNTFQLAVVGIFKALLWPALVIFKVLELLKI